MSDMSEYPWSATADDADAIHVREFDLLDRVIEVVVQSGAFSRPTLAAALQLTDRKVARLTVELEELGVIAHGAPDAQRAVLIHPFELSAFLGAQRSKRRSLEHAA